MRIVYGGGEMAARDEAIGETLVAPRRLSVGARKMHPEPDDGATRATPLDWELVYFRMKTVITMTSRTNGHGETNDRRGSGRTMILDPRTVTWLPSARTVTASCATLIN